MRIITRNNSNRIAKVKMTNTGKKTIQEAIALLPPESRTNINAIIYSVTEVLLDRYENSREEENNGNVDYQLKRMGMSSTLDIKEQVQLYLKTVAA